MRNVIVLSLISMAVGCTTSSNPWDKTVPATGVVTYKGKPIQGAELAFLPQDLGAPLAVRPKAKADENGRYIVWTYAQGDGAPPGEYKVMVVRHEVSVSKGTIVAKPNDLPKKYATFALTDILVTITDGQAELPAIDLR
jgi:hypothetical protein